MPYSNQFSPTLANPVFYDDQGNPIWQYLPATQTLYIGQAGAAPTWLTSFYCSIAASGGRFSVYGHANNEADEYLGVDATGIYFMGAPLVDAGGSVYVRSNTPATATSAGVAGQTCYDANYFYVCIATNTWRRIALSAGW